MRWDALRGSRFQKAPGKVRRASGAWSGISDFLGEDRQAFQNPPEIGEIPFSDVSVDGSGGTSKILTVPPQGPRPRRIETLQDRRS
jgi:hypothetical protein